MAGQDDLVGPVFPPYPKPKLDEINQWLAECRANQKEHERKARWYGRAFLVCMALVILSAIAQGVLILVKTT